MTASKVSLAWVKMSAVEIKGSTGEVKASVGKVKASAMVAENWRIWKLSVKNRKFVDVFSCRRGCRRSLQLSSKIPLQEWPWMQIVSVRTCQSKSSLTSYRILHAELKINPFLLLVLFGWGEDPFKLLNHGQKVRKKLLFWLMIQEFPI